MYGHNASICNNVYLVVGAIGVLSSLVELSASIRTFVNVKSFAISLERLQSIAGSHTNAPADEVSVRT